MEEYNLFAKYHDEIVRPEEWQIDDEVFFLDEIFEDFSSGKEILESACGSWQIMKELIKKWYNIDGFDLSSEMISKAKKSWLENVFVWDMTKYISDKKYDIVLCNYNSICHLLSFDAWKDFFECSFQNLKKWWILVFDITTLYEFESLVEDFTMSKNIWENTLCLSVIKKDSKYIRDVRIFEKASDWRFDLISETVSEISFEIEKIKNELSKKFNLEAVIDYHNFEISEFSERVYFVARKK